MLDADADAGILNATKSCAMFLRLAAARGAHLRDRTTVTGLRQVPDSRPNLPGGPGGSAGTGRPASGSDGPGVRTVRTARDLGGGAGGGAGDSGASGGTGGSGGFVEVATSRGVVRARRVVLCAGPWSAQARPKNYPACSFLFETPSASLLFIKSKSPGRA